MAIKICVVISAFKRFEITLMCIKRILNQTIRPFRVVVVGSEPEDKKLVNVVDIDYLERPNYFYKEIIETKGLTRVQRRELRRLRKTSLHRSAIEEKMKKPIQKIQRLPFRALSNKFQAGVDHCRKYNPDAIMICGSDDLLSLNWIEDVSKFIRTYDVVGTDHLYSIRFDPLSIIISSYKGTPRYGEPAGPGRIISSRILEKLNWKLYEEGLSQNLDSNSFLRLKDVDAKICLYASDKAKILSVKGPWEHITHWHDLLTISCEEISDSIRWIHENNFSEVLEFYKPVESEVDADIEDFDEFYDLYFKGDR